MAEADELLPPIEIPWKLASTTQPLSAGEPAETALTLFFFEPDDETLTSKFPDDRLVFVKFTASISPAKFPAELSKVAATFLGEGIPCMHVLLDLKVRNAAGDLGTIRPYFHTAAPLNRRMVQTGVVGVDAYEGEADALAIGKSGSQMNESLRSHSNTLTTSASAGLSIGPVSLGGSVRNTTTDVASDRAVSQVVDTTNREASEERRELISHTTRVENIISLLSAKYVGTPHLSFSVSPQPLAAALGRPVGPEPVVPAAAGAPLERHRGHPGVHRGDRRAQGHGFLHQRATAPRVPARQPAGTVQPRRALHRHAGAAFADGQLPQRRVPHRHAARRARHRHHRRPDRQRTVPPAGGRAVGVAAAREPGRGVRRVAGRLGRRRGARPGQLQALSRSLARHAARRVRARGVAFAARARRAVRREPPPRHLLRHE